jgi:Universal stress protein family
MEHIVVGIDGSAASRRALSWAVDQARARDASVEAIPAWTVPDMGADPLAQALADPEELAPRRGGRSISSSSTSATARRSHRSRSRSCATSRHAAWSPPGGGRTSSSSASADSTERPPRDSDR